MIIDKAIAILKKDAINSLRYRNGFLVNLIAPLAQLATFYYLSRAVGPQFRPEGMPYFLFLLIGSAFYTFLLTGMHSFLRIVQEAQQTGTLEVLMSTSTSPALFLGLSTISAFVGALLQLAVYLVAGIFISGPLPHIHFAECILIIALSSLIALAIGMCAAGIQIAIQKGSAMLWLLGSGAWLLAGTLFPVASLPRSARMAAALLPFTHSLTGMRLAFQSSTTSYLNREIFLLLLFSLVLVPFGLIFFSWTVRRARQLGTLSFY